MMIQAVLDMPPTSNNIYFNIRGGGRGLTTEARSWKRRAVGEIVRQNKLGLLTEGVDPNLAYAFALHYYFADVENRGWHELYTRGVKNGQRKAASRWKKMDLGNRDKLIQDALKNALGVDDSSIFERIEIKDVDPKNPRVEILFTLVENIV